MSEVNIVVEQKALTVEQGSSVKTVVLIEGSEELVLDVVTPEGVADDYDVDSGELTLVGNAVGEHVVTLNAITAIGDSAATETITLTVVADSAVEGEVNTADQDAPAAEQEEPAEELAEALEEPAAKAHPEQDLMVRLEQYLAVMAPKTPVDPVMGGKHQLHLLRTIQYVLNKPVQDFGRYYTTLLNFVREHRQGAFHEGYINRFMDTFPGHGSDRIVFTRMTNLLLASADVSDRQLVKNHVDFDLMASTLTDQTQYQKLASYYNPRGE